MNLPISELARRTAVKVPTIRFYEQIGLLAMSAEPQASSHQADSIARNHLGEIERRIASPQALGACPSNRWV